MITGAGTIQKDDPKFNSRLPKQTLINNVAILDTDLELYEKYLKKSLIRDRFVADLSSPGPRRA